MPKKTLDIRVTTVEAVMEFQIEEKSTGKQLFELVTTTVGVREVWYFGLKYKDDKGLNAWLKDDKKIIDQNVPKSKQKTLEFHFQVKFFPEDVGDELVQEVTQHLFYLQVKDEILCGDIYCQVETAVLLASCIIQAENGGFDAEILKPGFLTDKKLLPQKVIDEYHTAPGLWEERTSNWCSEHKGMLREEAELEYLKIAQALEMCGVHYFEAKDKKGTVVWIGIEAAGMNMYGKGDRKKPIVSYPWIEIKRVSYNGKKVIVTQIDKSAPNFIFYVSNTRISDLIMQLCIGNNELYHRRRRTDTLEVQQMKALANEERARKIVEKMRLKKEIKARKDAEEKKAELEEKIKTLENKSKGSITIKEQTDEALEVSDDRAEKDEKTEEGVHNQTNGQECSQLEREKEQKAIDRISQMIEEQVGSEIQATKEKEMKAQELRRQLEETKLVVEAAKMKLLEATGGPKTPPRPTASVTPGNDSVDGPGAIDDNQLLLSPEWVGAPHGEAELIHDGAEQPSSQLKRDRTEYQQKYKDISEKLKILKTEMDDLKRKDKVSKHELLHEGNIILLQKLTLLLSDIQT